MKVALTQFASNRHFSQTKMSGTVIRDMDPSQFIADVNERMDEKHADYVYAKEGYADFCRLVFLRNWTSANLGAIKITDDNKKFLQSDYKARTSSELPVLTRWFEGVPAQRANYLVLVLYSKEQLDKEGSEQIDGDWGIVAILGQNGLKEEPMTPETMTRNALGIEYGGSGTAMDRNKYKKSVHFWQNHATVKI